MLLISFESFLYECIKKSCENIDKPRGYTLFEMENIYKQFAKLNEYNTLYDEEIYTIYYAVECLKHLNKIKKLLNDRYVLTETNLTHTDNFIEPENEP